LQREVPPSQHLSEAKGAEIHWLLSGRKLLSGTCTLHSYMPDEAVETTCSSCPEHHFACLQLYQVVQVEIFYAIYLDKLVIPQVCHHVCLLLLKFHSSTAKNLKTAYVCVAKILDPRNFYPNSRTPNTSTCPKQPVRV